MQVLCSALNPKKYRIIAWQGRHSLIAGNKTGMKEKTEILDVYECKKMPTGESGCQEYNAVLSSIN